MSDTKLPPPVSTRKPGARNPVLLPTKAASVPGARHCGDTFDDLTETEVLLIAAYRMGRRAEQGWHEYHLQVAWDLIRQFTYDVEDDVPIEKMQFGHDPEEFAVLHAAGVACAACTALLVKNRMAEDWGGEEAEGG